MKPVNLQAAIPIFFGYSAIIFTTWYLLGVDYTNLSGRDVILRSLILPMGLGCVFLVFFISRLGWWREVMREERRGRPHWTVWVVGISMVPFIGLNLLTIDWSVLSAVHLTLLIAASLLVGFNEEVLFRGVLVTGFRKRGFGEVGVWFWTCFLFAAIHIPNGFFGTGVSGAITQAISIFLVASAYYIFRRVGGTILVPIAFHAMWDFSTFASSASDAPSPMLALFGADILCSLLSTVLVIFVLRADRKSAPT